MKKHYWPAIASAIALAATIAASAATPPERPMMRKSRVPATKVSSVTKLLSPAPMRLPGSNSVLCGAMVYNDLWGETDDQGNYLHPVTAGMYSIQARPGGEVTRLKLNTDLIKMRAGVKVNSLYYTISTSNYDTEAALSIYNTSSWERRSSAEIDIVNVPSDMTYDPVSGNVYGFFFNESTQEYDRFCRFDTYYGEATQISTVDRNGFAIAANADGEIYGIWGYTGWLIKIDPKTGRYEQIGRTGFSPGYVNSLTFDDATGKLYWCANASDGYSALLEVDTATGAATELMHFDNNATFAGIFAMPYKVPDNAPAAPANIAAQAAAPGSCTVALSCTAPSKTVKGGALAGPLTVAFTVGGNTIEVPGVAPGANVTTDEITLPAGAAKVSVLAATDDLLGEVATLETWIGADEPAAPADLVLNERGGRPHLSWTAPTAGKHGGWFDPATLTYIVTRYPDKTAFAPTDKTEWTDESFTGNGSVYYGVKAVGTAGESDEAISAKMVFGEGFTVPFTETFSTRDDFDLWTVIDLNGHTTWEYDSKDKSIYYSYDKDVEAPGDDWIISPKIALEPGITYRLSLDAKNYYKSYKENFRVMLGQAATSEAMSQQILDYPDFDNPKGETVRASFTVAEAGYYYLGIYTYSPAHNWQLNIDNVGISIISEAVPAAVSNLSVTPGAQGALSATVSFNAPTEDSAGAALSDPLKINIYRNHTASPAVTLDAAPGAPVQWADPSIAQAGMVHYRVVASNEAGEGADSQIETWVGEDVPGAVQDLKATEQPDGSVTLSWRAPEAGAHGGWFNPAGMTYRVLRSDAEVIAQSTSETSLTDNSLKLTRQELLYYLVTPYIGDVKGQYANTDFEVYGPSIAAPLTEGFPAGDMAHYPWVSESNGSVYMWSIETAGILPSTADQNGDGGMAMFIATEANKGISGRLTSPKISVSALESPVLTFWMYHTEAKPESDETLKVLAGTHGGELQCVASVARGDGSGWTMHAVPLDALKGAASPVRIAFESTSLGGLSFYIDNISLTDKRDADLAIISLEVPSRTASGVGTPVSVKVVNQGLAEASGVKLTLQQLSGTQVVDSSEETLGTLAAGETAVKNISVNFAQTGDYTLVCRATCASSTGEASAAVKVVQPLVPAPTGLSASSADGNSVTLNWLKPSENGHVTDDFESYADWAIDNIGDYRTIDRDGSVTYYINKDLGEYPNCTAAKAWQVCNANTLGIDIWDEGKPLSGNKMLMSVASIDRANDDWLILPMLNGAEQTLTVHAKAFTAQDTPAERMRVLYSTSDCSPEDFEALHSAEYIEVPDMWTEYNFLLPEGTRWAAVNCVSDNAFALFIDDIAYDDLTVFGRPLAGYAVYRDGTEVARVDTPTWTDSAPADRHDYTVAALYDDGTLSAPSETLHVNLAGIDAIDAGDITVAGGRGTITILGGTDPLTCSIMSADGRIIAAGSARTYTVPAGVYLVKIAARTHKVSVK